MNINFLDTPDFIERVIRHLVRSPAVMGKALSIGLTADDFIVDDDMGNKTYREFADSALQLKNAPIDKQLFSNHIRFKIDSGALDASQIGMFAQFIAAIYTDELSETYVNEHLLEFIKRRRTLKLQHTHKEEPDKFAEEYAKLAVDIKAHETGENVQVYSPFASLVRSVKHDVIPTNIRIIDNVISGLGYGEMGLIIGHSGGGKTALACKIARGGVQHRKRVLYCCLEEPAANISNRFYSSIFRIPYTSLHKGQAERELAIKFEQLPAEERQVLTDNLRVVDLRDITPMSCNDFLRWVNNYAEETGFYPEEIMLDQMDYMKPNVEVKGMQQWQSFERIAFECDYLSQELIGGKQSFALWVLHQATGKMRKRFTNNEISGFKGIIKPADIVLGAGRDSQEDEIGSLFSLKSRHTKNFTYDVKFRLEFMDFEENTNLVTTSSSTSNPNGEDRAALVNFTRRQPNGNS